jgi:hypothetical protein
MFEFAFRLSKIRVRNRSYLLFYPSAVKWLLLALFSMSKSRNMTSVSDMCFATDSYSQIDNSSVEVLFSILLKYFDVTRNESQLKGLREPSSRRRRLQEPFPCTVITCYFKYSTVRVIRSFLSFTSRNRTKTK